MFRGVKRALCPEQNDATLPFVVDDEQPGSLGDHVARQLKRLREDKRMPYTELSQRLESLGHPIPVLGLRRIERGERRVDVDELAALALALNVPPLLLLFPIEGRDSVRIAPQMVMPVWEAAQWFTAEEAPQKWQPAGYWLAAAPFQHRRQHAEFERRHRAARSAGDDAALERIEGEWREQRVSIRRQGFTPPRMRRGFTHIAGMEGADEEDRSDQES